MSKLSRALLVLLSLSLVWSLLIFVFGMKGTVSWRLVATCSLAFWIVAYIVFRSYVRKGKINPDTSDSQSSIARQGAFVALASRLAKLYVVTGTASILLGVMATRNKDVFLAVGIVVLCFAAYLFFVSSRGGSA